MVIVELGPEIIPTAAEITQQQASQAAIDAKQKAIADANTALQSVVSSLAPGLAQAQTDLATLASSTDPLAPVLSRAIEAIATLAQAVNDALVYLEIIG